MKRILPLLLLCVAISSCNINPSVMFKTPRDFEFNTEQTIGNVEYRITPNDIIGFSVYTNDGFKLIDMTTSAVSINQPLATNANDNMTRFLVEPDGMVKLPIIGKVKVSGMTIREAEKSLEALYATFYNKPFVMISVLNRRVLVFTGEGGLGKVVLLQNENVTLIEALALAGGVNDRGKSKKIKLIRGDMRNPKVMLINLGTIEGAKKSNLMLQANDIIYVEPAPQTSNEIFQQIAPVVGIITSIALVVTIIKTL
jgi:polysaccharide export outer membrane protein